MKPHSSRNYLCLVLFPTYCSVWYLGFSHGITLIKFTLITEWLDANILEYYEVQSAAATFHPQSHLGSSSAVLSFLLGENRMLLARTKD